ncbi:MAG: septal ring factor EnvC (AmiA/AmiB activator) [Enterobacterales bacterium]|jgi:septal ring factor EnvC (AmiA/AmiB activator)
MLKFLLLMALLTPLIHYSASNDSRSQSREATEKQLSELQEKIKQLQKNQAKNRSSLTKEQQALKGTDVLIGKSRRSLEKNRATLRKSRSNLSSLIVQRKRLNKDKTKQQSALADQIRAAYAGGKQEYLKLLFNQEDPSKLGRTLVYYEYLNKARTEKIEALNQTLEKLVQVEKEITTEQKQLVALESELEQENTRLAGLKNKRQQAIIALNRSFKDNSKRLKEWHQNESDLISLLDALKKTVARMLPEESLNGLSSLRGKLNWPVEGLVKESFGRSRGSDKIRWSGVLISAKEGAPVSAIHHGRIVYSDYLRGFGLITIIDHGNGYMSLYGHNEALYKQPGDWVEAGEQVATVGQSGGYPSTGLYFEIRLKSKALNPVRFIRKN